VLCARCHGSNALGYPGIRAPQPVEGHAREARVHHNDCYQCHPGPATQCLRDVMAVQHGLTCQSCHGTVRNVAQSIEDGGGRGSMSRAAAPVTAPTTRSRRDALSPLGHGHGGLYCSACHSSPHAILPSREERDNRQNVALQATRAPFARAMSVTASSRPAPAPTVSRPTDPRRDGAAADRRLVAAPNPMTERTEIEYR